MVLLSLFLADVPIVYTAFTGLAASLAQVMSLLSMILLSLPVEPVVVLKKTMPAAASMDDPFSVQYFTVLEVASLMNRMVEVPAVDTALVLLMSRLLPLPLAPTLPSMVTLSAPFRSMRGAASDPVMLSPAADG